MDLQLDQLRALAAVIDAGTLEAAARSLQITPSAVSQRIKALETGVGRVLLQRTKPAQVTGSGQAVLRLARELELLVADTTASLEQDGAPRTRVVLVANADSLATWMLPALAQVAGRVMVELHREDQDHSAGLLRDGTVMAAVTSQATPVQGCSVRPLGRMRYRPRASAAFVAQWFPHGASPSALAAAPVVFFDHKDDLQARYLRQQAGPDADPPRHYIPGAHDFAQALRLGLGWGMLPDLQVHAGDDLAVIEDTTVVDVPLHWQQWKLRTPALDLLADAVVAHAARALALT